MVGDGVGTQYVVEIPYFQILVDFWAPAFRGVRAVVDRSVDAAVGSLSIYILYVVEACQLLLYGRGGVDLHAEGLSFAGRGLLRGDHDDAVAGLRAVQGRCGGAFQYGDVLDVVGVDARNAVSQVISAVLVRTAEIGVVDGHSVHYVQRLVVSREHRAASDLHMGGAAGASGGLADDQARFASRQRVDDVQLPHLFERFAFDVSYRVSQRFAFTGHAQRGDHDVLDRLAGRFELDGEVGLGSHLNLGCFVAEELYFEDRCRGYLNREFSRSGCRSGCRSLNDDGGAAHRIVVFVGNHTGHSSLLGVTPPLPIGGTPENHCAK